MKLTVKKFQELTTTELYEILKARAEIFIMEQDINYQDMDDIDYKSLHCFFTEDKKVIAYLRAFYQENDGDIVRIGRVLTLQHGNGTGRDLLEQSLRKLSWMHRNMQSGFMKNSGLKRYPMISMKRGSCMS